MKDAPLWQREGVAVWAEDPSRTSASAGALANAAREACPADAEFARAASAEALRVVYERAGACYVRFVRGR
jgi:hypothetical protein